MSGIAGPNSLYKRPAPGEEIVISGISGRYPSSRNVEELKNNLMNKVDLVTSYYHRWGLDHPKIPKEGGLIGDLEKFDSVFFGVHTKQAHAMDPMCRMILEHAYEAVIDAGINPKKLRGTNTGVIIGVSYSETEQAWFNDKLQENGFGVTGCSKAMLANRISYFLGLHGPSLAVDTACSSSTVALDCAFKMIQSGECDKVIVGGANVCLHPYMSLQFALLGLLSPEFRCKTFAEEGNGYVRSETVCTILLEKANVAKRIYATIFHSRSNCDGYKEEGITFPSSDMQTKLFKDFYRECNLSPTCISYLEAHGTGTPAGDPQELNSISNVFVEGRTTPLKIGSIKSNIGHAEPASGVCSITKVIIALETGIIPPNLHFKTPLKGIKYLEDGRLHVVTEPTPLEGDYVALNSFGFGGANVHVLFKSNAKEKVNNGAPNDDLPRLVVVSGRTEEAVSTLLDTVENKPVDVEYIRLLHNVYCENINGYLFRGYTIAGPKPTENVIREIKEYPQQKRPIWFVFSGMGSQWAGMGEALLRFPIFKKAIDKCDVALRPHGVDIYDVLTNKDKKTFDHILNSFIGIAAVQIGLFDLLTSMGIEPDYIIGHSTGELGCAYADGCFTTEQTILAAYSRGLASIETETIRGSMAAVGLGYEQIKDMCPPDIEVACHNSSGSSTLSGPAESMNEFVKKLEANKIFAKEVPCGNIAYHSHYIASMGPKLLAYLKKIVPNSKPRSSKWLSTSIPRSEWSKPEAKLSSPEYHTNNLLNSVLFAETATLIPEDAVAIEIAPHGLLQAILRRSLSVGVTNVPLTQRGHKDNVEYFLQALGKLYNAGLEPQLANIYPPVEFPVSRGTPMISPYIRWEHSDDWRVLHFAKDQKVTTGERTVQVALRDENYQYMAHHVIDGRNLIPATGYLVLVWETFATMHSKSYHEMSVVFENIKFERATNIPKEGSVYLHIMVQRGTGRFEVVETNTSILSGTIRRMFNPVEEELPTKYTKECDDDESLNTRDIYKELNLRGYQYTGPFRGLKRASVSGTKGHIAWMNNWAAFMDNMLQIQLLPMDTRELYVPTSILKLTIDVDRHNDVINSASEDNIEIPVYVYRNFNTVFAGGVEICELNATAIFRRKQMATPVLEEYKFVANCDNAEISLIDMITLTTHLALEDRAIINPNILEFVTDNDNVIAEQLLGPVFLKVLGDLPTIQPVIILAAKSNRYENESLPPNVTITEPQEIPEDASVYIAAGYDIFTKKKTNALERLLLALTDDGFLLTRETAVDENTFLYARTCGLNVVLEKRCKGKTLLLLKKVDRSSKKTEVVRVSNDKYDWLEKVQSILKGDNKTNIENKRLIIVAEDDLENGALGFVKCLKKEPNGQVIRSVIVQDKNAPKFSLDNPLYAKQLELNNTINVLRPGNIWGTYRHLPLPPLQRNPVYHGYVNQTVRGDINSIQWVEGSIPLDMKSDLVVHVAYSSLNFRDVMLATGKLPVDVVAKTRKEQDCVIGVEYSGVTTTGRRVMGVAPSMALANVYLADPYLQWDVPDYWTLEEAATVPVAYATAYEALYISGRMKKGEKILIHSGTGSLGQAAINFALHEGCEVFTTVGTPEKRKFIRDTFPNIDDDHIGSSRDTSFEKMISEKTNGKGVDIVLNSLAEEKLQATIRCLGTRGRFLEVGKFDISANNQLGLGHFKKELSFHCIMLDNVINGGIELQKELHKVMVEVFKMKAVKPIVRTCFERDEVQAAFRYMAAGKHIGKVVIKIREDNKPVNPVLAYPRFHASPNKNYLLVGGLGGLGLEIADWLVLRGAKNLTLISRVGIRNGYQLMRTELWKSYGVNVKIISGLDVSNTRDCELMLKSAEKQAPVDSIFNLAALLRDGLCVNQTVQSFEESLKPKMWITKKLDKLSRKICPQLCHFVVLSSTSCGRGNIGQSNYGMGNAVMERICERRVSEGLPGLAIQFGAVGDVGLAAEMFGTKEQLDISGTFQQRLSSCLEVLDRFMMEDRTIVGSMIVAEKRANDSAANSAIEAVMNIMSMTDLKGMSQTSTLAEIGMDSMMAVEIKQTLERDFDITLSAQDIRNLSIGKLLAMSEKDSGKDKKKNVKRKAKSADLHGMKLLLRNINPEMLNNDIYVELAIKTKETEDEVFLLPGVEGIASVFTSLALKLTCPATCFQLVTSDGNVTVENITNTILPHALERIKGRKRFTILGYSFGSAIAIELARRLEAHGFEGRLILVDGAPDYMKAVVHGLMPGNVAKEFENNLLLVMMNILTQSAPPEFLSELNKCDTWEKKLDKLAKYAPPEFLKVYTLDTLRSLSTLIYNRLRCVEKYDYRSLPPITAPITLFKPTVQPVHVETKDYGLSQITQGRVDVHEVEGNHLTILEDEKIVAAILGKSFS